MIQQIYITDYLSDAAIHTPAVVQRLTEQCPLLLKADWEVISSTPLNALFDELSVAESHAKRASAVSAVLFAKQNAIKSTPALCLLPVHLGLQRDTFSLQGTVQISTELYALLTEKLQRHFAEDFIVHAVPGQRFWWIQPLNTIDVQCQWPQDCLYQQAFQWQPQGKDASLVRQWTNEIQMFLHQLSSAGNLPDWPEQLNSLWFASVPDLPAWKHQERVVHGKGDVFDGLRSSQLPFLQSLPMIEVVESNTISQALMVVDQPDQVDWQLLQRVLQDGKVSALELVLPFAERSVRILYRKRYRWQFWRKAYTLQGLFEKLESSLPAFKLPETI